MQLVGNISEKMRKYVYGFRSSSLLIPIAFAILSNMSRRTAPVRRNVRRVLSVVLARMAN